LKALINQDRKNKQEIFVLEAKIKSLEDELKKQKDDNRKMAPLIAHYCDKIKKL
jgi:hypothetical protein